MQINALPDDIDALKRLILARDTTVEHLQQQLVVKQQESVNLTLLIEKLKLQIARFKRTQFGQSSERYPGELMQLELLVEDLEANQAQSRVPESDQAVPISTPPAEVKDQPRRTLPPHLPRQRIEHTPSCTCSTCGATMVKIGEEIGAVQPRNASSPVDVTANDCLFALVMVVFENWIRQCNAGQDRVQPRKPSAFLDAPSVVLAPLTRGGLEVDFLAVALADVRNVNIAGLAVETAPPRIAQSESPDLRPSPRFGDERVGGRDLVVLLRIGGEVVALHVDPQHFAEQLA